MKSTSCIMLSCHYRPSHSLYITLHGRSFVSWIVLYMKYIPSQFVSQCIYYIYQVQTNANSMMLSLRLDRMDLMNKRYPEHSSP
ncbi:uncharacterized protein LACBIDRAFT_306428 [Laccaria bicolor S238N-H82]|uniref:Predicted protein n=1 Tax=Laccaria bicolor (strain S238N-H82 / ATCC MYA-4686) TaxID=486041 RepID=B0DMW5_LACBS|nr:uncharacterized protein LACBIDRAFT_306428 [Laccaria bicolor S238N-H82]EDR04122.1 predicted protein [Laccaria bicolor S238N-H82]|eukprot:XP_001885377.1 predicted protein [Laccaria bicolor S238N-H82]